MFECLLKKPKVIVTDKTVVLYRNTENSASRSGFSDKYFDITYFADRKYTMIEEHCKELLYLAENIVVKANMALLQNMLKTSDRKYRALERKAVDEVVKRKRFYKKALKENTWWFWVISHRLYRPFKAIYRLIYKM